MRYLILISLALISCNPQKKTQRYLFEHPEFSAEYCAEQYPVRDSVIIKETVRYDTVLDIISWVDTVYKEGDTIYKFKTIYKNIVKTVTKDSIIYRVDAAEQRRLQLALQACQNGNNVLIDRYNAQVKETGQWKGRAKTRFWWILLLIGGGVVYAGVKLKKYFLT